MRAGSRVCVGVWLVGALLVCVASLGFLGGLLLAVGLFWLIGGWLIRLCSVLSFLVSVIVVCV